ncbi:NAD-dependent epimerase/dehydratase family protein [bacterium]|nr:NAD-dependent epimerase/dehydratase family protein [bacterium]
MYRCLVTGGAGFIGSNLVDKLIDLGFEVSVIDNLSSGKEEYINSKAKFYNLDIRSIKVKEIFKKERFHFVFHLAAQIDVRFSIKNPETDNHINVVGGVNILENCKKNNVRKIIFASTGGAIYGEDSSIPTLETAQPYPISPYGINKLCFEKYLNYYHKVFGQDYTVLRFANIYGPRQYKGGECGVVSIFIDKAINDEIYTINGDGSKTRDFVYVDDVVDAFIKAMDSEYSGEINIGLGKEVPIFDIVRFLDKALGKRTKRIYDSNIPGEQERSCLDASLARNILGWSPKVNLEEGIKKTIKWSQRNSI